MSDERVMSDELQCMFRSDLRGFVAWFYTLSAFGLM